MGDDGMQDQPDSHEASPPLPPPPPPPPTPELPPQLSPPPPVTPRTDGADAQSWWRRRWLKLPVWAWATAAVVVAALAVGAAVGSGGDEPQADGIATDTQEPAGGTADADAVAAAADTGEAGTESASTEAPATTSPATTTSTAAPTTTSTTTTTTTTTTVAPETGTADSPLPVGDPTRSTFTYSSFVGDSWDGYLAGIVEVGLHEWNDGDGRCLVVVGTITATSVDGATSNPFGTPEFAMIVDGRVADSTVTECDTEAVKAAGYRWILDAEVTQGTTYPFYVEFFLPSDAAPSALLVGNPTGKPAFFDATPTGDLPPIGEITVGDVGQELLPLGDPAASVFSMSDMSDDSWDGYLAGLVEVGRHEWNDAPGRCLVLVGTLTATSVDGATSNPYTTPDFSMIVDGRVLHSDVSVCDVDAIQAAGYSWVLNAEVVEGTVYPFYDEFFIPDGAGEIEAVVAGWSSSSDALFFDPQTRADIPAP